jgi:integrase
MPNVLQELMRHDNIQTTMRYYVGQNAQRTSAILWEAHRAQAVGGVLGGGALIDS